MTDQSTAADKPPIHLGEIVRKLREAAGLTRAQLSEQTNIATTTIKNLEIGRYRADSSTLRKLLLHPSMATLHEKAKEAGLSLGLGDNGSGEK